MPDRPRTAMVMDPDSAPELFPPELRRRLLDTAEVAPERVLARLPGTDGGGKGGDGGDNDGAEGADGPDQAGAHARTLADLARTEVLLTGWGCPVLDAPALDLMPKLRAVVHAAGTVKTFVTGEVFARGVQVSSAADANAVPVAEFTLAAVVFGAKRAFSSAHRYRHREPGGTKRDLAGHPWIGTRGTTVGLVGASRTGRRVIALLRGLDAEVLVHDPYLTAAEAAELGVERVDDLDLLVARSQVLSLHAPAVPATRHLLDRRRLALLPDGAVLVNTARGSLVDTEALTAEVAAGRLDAVLDVTDPEPLPPGHPLLTLPGAFVTPHLAGALGNETARLGAAALGELDRFARGLPFRHPVTGAEWDRIA